MEQHKRKCNSDKTAAERTNTISGNSRPAEKKLKRKFELTQTAKRIVNPLAMGQLSDTKTETKSDSDSFLWFCAHPVFRLSSLSVLLLAVWPHISFQFKLMFNTIQHSLSPFKKKKKKKKKKRKPTQLTTQIKARSNQQNSPQQSNKNEVPDCDPDDILY